MPLHHGGYPESHPEYRRPAFADRGDRRAVADGVNYEVDHESWETEGGFTPIVDGGGEPDPLSVIEFEPDTRITIPLTFNELQQANIERGRVWGKGQRIPSLFNGVELGGEAGELLEAFVDCAAVVQAVGKTMNAHKKYARHELGIAGGNPDLTAIEEELGDVVICCSLLANKLGINLGQAVASKFNKTSVKHGFPHRLRVA